MAEIRKHQPTLRDEIDAAILAALGEDVRYVPPGSTPEPISHDKPAAPAVTPTGLPISVEVPAGWVSLDPKTVARPLGKQPPAEIDEEGDGDE